MCVGNVDTIIQDALFIDTALLQIDFDNKLSCLNLRYLVTGIFLLVPVLFTFVRWTIRRRCWTVCWGRWRVGWRSR